MKTLLTRSTLLLGLMTCASASLAFPALSQSDVHPLFDLTCEQGYHAGVLQNSYSGEFLYRSKGPNGELGLRGGTRASIEGAEVYKFQNGAYEYQVVYGMGDNSKQGALGVYKDGRSIMNLRCTHP